VRIIVTFSTVTTNINNKTFSLFIFVNIYSRARTNHNYNFSCEEDRAEESQSEDYICARNSSWPGFPELDSVSTGLSKIGVLRKVISGNSSSHLSGYIMFS